MREHQGSDEVRIKDKAHGEYKSLAHCRGFNPESPFKAEPKCHETSKKDDGYYILLQFSLIQIKGPSLKFKNVFKQNISMSSGWEKSILYFSGRLHFSDNVC